MNKLLNKIVAIGLGMVAAIGVGVGLKNTNEVSSAKAAAETYSYTFSGTQWTANGDKTLGGVTWTLSGDGGYWGFDNNNGKGQQFGSSGKPYKSMSLKSKNKDWGTISSISVNTSGAKSISGSFKVLVGGTKVGSKSLTSSAATYSFTGLAANGDIEFSYTQTSSKAIYIKSISVTYELKTISGVLNALDVDGSLTKTSYYPGETWSSAGLVPTASYDDGQSNNVTGKDGLVWSFNPAVPAVGVTSLEVTATYTEGEVTLSDSITLGVTVYELDTIAITGESAKTTYSQNDQWNHDGLTVSASYTNGDPRDVTAKATWSYSPETPAVGVTSLEITATYTEGEKTVSTTFTTEVVVEYTERFDFSENFSTYASEWGQGAYGSRTVTSENVGFGYNSKVTLANASKQQTTITDIPVIAAVKDTAVGVKFELLDSSVVIKEFTVYFKIWSNSKWVNAQVYNGTSTSGTALTTSTQISGSSSVAGALVGITVSDVETNEFYVNLTATSTSRQQIGLSHIDLKIEDVPGYEEALTYAETFLNNVGCDATGETAPAGNWDELATQYALLSDDAKALFANAEANTSGTNVEKAVATYDYILSKYGTETYANFMERTVTSNSLKGILALNNNDTVSTLIVVMAAVLLTSACLYTVIRRKNELTK